MQLRAVHLIDTAYGGEKYRKSAVRAQRLFAGWFREAWPGRWEVRDVHYDGFCFVCWVLQDMEVNLQVGKQSKNNMFDIYIYTHICEIRIYNYIQIMNGIYVF